MSRNAGTTKGAKKRADCSVRLCAEPVLARGWCKKHYARWRKHGDPTFVHPRLKGAPGVPVVESRMIRGHLVRFTADGRTFVDVQRKRGMEVQITRRYGVVFVCAQCGKEAFCKSSGSLRQVEYCGHDCAGKATGHKKLGRTRSSTTPKNATGHLDKLFSALVRADGRCTHCGSVEHLQCAHGFSRRYRTVRWDIRNAFPLCAKCHMRYTHRPLEWDEWLRERWGEAQYTELRRLALQTDHKVDIEAVKAQIVAEIRRRGITVRRLPASVSGWAGISDDAA